MRERVRAFEHVCMHRRTVCLLSSEQCAPTISGSAMRLCETRSTMACAGISTRPPPAHLFSLSFSPLHAYFCEHTRALTLANRDTCADVPKLCGTIPSSGRLLTVDSFTLGVRMPRVCYACMHPHVHACIQLSLQCTHTHSHTRPLLPSRVCRFPAPVRQGLHRGGLAWSDSSAWSHGPRDSWCGTTVGWFAGSLLSRLTQKLLSHNAVL